MDARPQLVGNRLVLVGSVLYLMEWVAIIAAGIGAPVGAAASRQDLLSAYVGHEQALGWAAGWFSVVLLGRVLVTTGLRSALAESGRPQRLMDFAVVAMAVGVALEIATYALVAGISWLSAHGGTVGQLRAVDAVSFALDGMLWGPTGLALACCGVAMWQSELFPRPLAGLGLVAGAMLVVVGLGLQAPRFAGLSGAVSSAALLFWVWMLWTGVLLWRRTGVSRPVSAPVPDRQPEPTA
ncbi:MAG: hypothetical protein ACXVXD_04435 [Nocardioidaceae bacterium]